MPDKEDNKKKRVVVLPDYLEGQEDHVKHAWREWEALTHKIDNYPGRFQTIVNQKTGQTRTVDCKTSWGIMKRIIKNFSVSPEQAAELERVTKEIQVYKTKKGAANVKWSRYVFGKKRGDKSILGVRSAELIDMFGRYYSVEEVTKFIRKEWGFSIKHDTVKDFFVKNKDKIERKRAEFVLKGKETRLATDAGRLEVLSNLAWEFEQKFKKTQSIEVSKELRNIIEQIRKEIKGEEIKLSVDGRIDINATIQANKTLNEALSKLPINMIVIGLTAAKQRINPSQLISSLANSYYSRFNGFNDLGDKNEIDLPGKFIKQYDWGEIKRKTEENNGIEDVQHIDEEEVTPAEKAVVEDKKKKLLSLLEQYKNKKDV